MPPEQHLPAGQDADPQPLHPTSFWKTPTPITPALTLYQVPIPDAVPVQLPDGRTAWARPVQERLIPETPEPTPTREPMPAWAKAFSLAAGSLTILALGGAAALRIAAPALGDLVDVLDMLFRVALVLAALLFGGAVLTRILLRRATTPLLDDATRTAQEQPPAPTVVFAPHIDTGGDRLFGRSGSVTVQLGDRNRAKH
ncbi:hypothetical protein [Streptomyces sp. CNQ431]|uniref:hypothetical protein n=1 Tax=Streptomyces sp. CNQ431 TaxID=1571532 RepID=UPI00053ED5BD|nr:hypothetical protein [Streptomyces sp. CNQ431]